MDIKVKNLIDKGVIICGKIEQEKGIVRFKRVTPSELESISSKERAYATTSMGRAVFTIDENGKIHNFKGVNSHLAILEIGPAELVNAKSIEYIPNDDVDSYKISAIVFNNKNPEIRINGTSPLEDIEIEADINQKLSLIGVKVPKIQYVREFSQEYSLKYGLPIKVSGSLKEFNSDYAKQDDKRKLRLKNNYGENYIEELTENQRPETMKEYLQRVGFLSSSEVKKSVETLGFSMQDFIQAVDKSYSRGQRYGQAERIMDSPFRISDLEICNLNKNIEQLQAIFEFSESNNPNFFNILAQNFGKNLATLMNNGWECENLVHRQDFSLSGEFCDDSYFNIFERQEETKEKYKNEPYKAEASLNEIKRKYSSQVMHIASCIRVVQKSMTMLGRNEEAIQSVLNNFVQNYVNNLDYNKISELFGVDKKTVQSKFIGEFSQDKSWTEKMSALDRKEGLVIDEAIYNSHISNEDFYSTVSKLIAQRLIIKRKENEISER